MRSFLLFSFLSFFSCFLTAHALAIEQRSSCITPDVVAVSQQVSDPHYFCTWFLSESPISKINANALLTACKCITSVEPAGTKAKTLAAIAKAAHLQSFVSATCVSANPINAQFKDPSSFCTFFNSFQRHDSPIPNLNVPAVRQACKCALAASKSSTKTSSTSSKVSTRSSSTKISTKASAVKSLSSSISSSKTSSSKSSAVKPSSNQISTKSSSSKISIKPASTSSTGASASKSSTAKALSSRISSATNGKPVSSTIKSSTSPTITTSSHPLSGAGLGFTVTRPTSLNPVALSYYKEITSGIKYNSQGTIIGRLKEPTLTSSLPAVTANAMDRSAQPSLQSQLQDVGLPSFNATVSGITAAMDNALMGNVSTNSTTGVFGDPDDSDLDPTSNQTSSALARHRLAKRYSWGEFFDDVDTYACNDFVTSLSETIEGACAIKDGAEAIYCLATGCYKTAAPPTQYTFDNTYSLTMPSFSGGYVYKDATSTLVCNDCGMSVSNLRIRGTIVVDLQSGSLLSSTMTLSQNTVQRFNMGIYTNGPASGSWSYVMSTASLQSITAPGVFTISPQALYAIGATWSTSQSSSLTFGATSTLNGASVDFDTVQGGIQNDVNWAPSLDITQPKLTGSGATLIPWIQSSVQISLNVLGRYMPNAVTVNSQVSLGFTQSYVTLAKLGHAQCGGGQLQSTSYKNVENSINIANWGSVPMYRSSGHDSPVCKDAQAAPPSAAQVSALKAVSGADKFCSSFIGYKASTVTVSVTTTLTKATSTVSVIGSGTTTITPPMQTSTETITSSVSSITQNFKRAVTTTRDSYEIERRALVARRVIPTPTILSTWLPQQVSAACSSMATGVVQASVTSTRIISSGVTTATIQGTVTANASITTTTSIVYAPAVSPYNVVSDPDVGSAPGTSNAWTFSGASNNYYFHYSLRKYHIDQTIERGQILGTGSISQVLTGLEPGWTYNLTLNTGFDSTTDTCTVAYSLDGVAFESYSPSNTGDATTNIVAFLDRSHHAIMKPDGPYQIVPTATTQTLSISMSCLTSDGVFAEFAGVNFWGPLPG
ncbi:hypothetical protein E4T48_01042 [Aureobasidium sp. EXF-10727]|nr:hypothetical protein E4T48_01042 [Aureobasidium sp. EXF-10727]